REDGCARWRSGRVAADSLQYLRHGSTIRACAGSPQPAGGILPHGVGQLWNRQSHCCTAPSGTSLGRGDSTRLVEKQQPRVAAGVALGGRWSRFLGPKHTVSERPVFKCPASDFAHNRPALPKFSSTVYISAPDVHDLG